MLPVKHNELNNVARKKKKVQVNLFPRRCTNKLWPDLLVFELIADLVRE